MRISVAEHNIVCMIATDGSRLRNGRVDALIGAAVYCAADETLNVDKTAAIYPTRLEQPIATLLQATESVKMETHLIEETDSQTVMESVTTWRSPHEDEDQRYILQNDHRNEKPQRWDVPEMGESATRVTK